jgi:hypothetical protein
MSPREPFWFLAGALTTVAVLVSTGVWNPFARPYSSPERAVQPAALTASASSGAPTPMTTGTTASMTMPVAGGMQRAPLSAGSLEEVTRKLAARLASRGGSDGEWRLLAQSYEYMGLTSEARAAQAHISLSEGNLDHGAATGNAGTVQAVSTEQMAAVAQLLDSQGAPNARAATVADGSRTATPRQAGP